LNNKIGIAKEYHKITKHSPSSVYSNIHFLDWENKPLPFKFFNNLDLLYLPSNFPLADNDVITCLQNEQNFSNMSSNKLDLMRISQILFLSAGITRVQKINNSIYYMRSASATGALYPIEIYLACTHIRDLEDGIYHFCPGDFTLTKLHSGDYRSTLYHACGNNEKIITSPITLIFTSISWRNSWKYQDRSYRHWFWDVGTIISNYLSLCNANSLLTEIIVGFQDDLVNKIISLPSRKEAAIVLSPLGVGTIGEKEISNKHIDNLDVEFDTIPISRYGEPNFPQIWKVHEGSYLEYENDVKKWVEILKTVRYSKKPDKISLERENLERGTPLYKVILQRGSTRKFSQKPITQSQLEKILYLANKNIPFDFIQHDDSLIDIYLIVNAVEGLKSGSYFYDKINNTLNELETGDFRKASEHLCLDQKLFFDASSVCFILADINKILKKLGNRGYRAVQLEGGIRLGKIYLAAYAQGLGASGSTFYDDEVTNFFLPHSINRNPILAAGIGTPNYVSKSGKIHVRNIDREDILKNLVY
jgi:SagB-type dehydrogenase family enzyme